MKKLVKINCGGQVFTVSLAERFFSRLRGLIGRETGETEALLISPCSQIHCMFMSYSIDAVYLSKDWKIIRIDSDMKPWSIGKKAKGCRHVLEMKNGKAEQCNLIVGDTLHFTEMEE